MVNDLKKSIRDAAEKFAEHVSVITAEAIRADIVKALGIPPEAPVVSVPPKVSAPKNKAVEATPAPVVPHVDRCLEPGCASERLAKGLCRKHYYAMRREAKKVVPAAANGADANPNPTEVAPATQPF